MMNPPDWIRDAVIYEVNVRQYTREGTFSAFRQHLPRLKDLGVRILWFMPVHPIGEKKRKGSLGSYYSIKDYKEINPEFGTFLEFKALVSEIHDLGMYVLLDWVANHTAWDNPLLHEHPDWFVKDENRQVLPPFDWEDVADLDYSNPDLCNYMTECMLFWIREADVDGFRCDVANLVPEYFWNQARETLDREKKIFMLAEAEHPAHHISAFDMCYATRFHRTMNDVAAGKKTPKDLKALFASMKHEFPPSTWFMQFVSNHDENSWNGTEFERYGEAVKTYIHLMFTMPDMPLIYSGMETGLTKRLKFFEKDEIPWCDSPYLNIYKSLIQLKKENRALWNGGFGGKLTFIETNQDDKLLCFVRRKDDACVLILLNFANENVHAIMKENFYTGTYTEFYTKKERTFTGYDNIVLAPFEFNIFIS